MATKVSFVVKNLAGTVVRKGTCDEHMLEHQYVSRDETIEQVTAETEIPEIVDDATRVYTYGYPRFMSYPDVREQLDAIWDVFAQNPEMMTPKARLVFERVMGVKDQFPKTKRFIQKTDGTFEEYNG